MLPRQDSARTSLSLFLSTSLHASAIALIALGPTFIPGLNGAGDRDTTTLEFSVAEEMPATLADIRTVRTAIEEKPVVAPDLTKKVAVAKPVTKPVTKKSKPKVAVVEKASVSIKEKAPAPKVATKLPEKAVETPQTETSPVVAPLPEVEDVPAKETLAAQEKTEEVYDTPAEAGAAPIENDVENERQEEPVAQSQEELPAPVVAAENATQELQPEAVAPVTEAPQTVATTEPAQSPTSTAAPITSAASQAPAAKTAEASGGGSAGNPNAIQITQNYLGLRQLPGNQPPSYSRGMRLKRMQGRGQLVYFVTKEGRVSQVRLTRSTGFPELDYAAVEAFNKYRFVPGQEGFTVHDFEFSLKGPAENDAGRLRTTMRN